MARFNNRVNVNRSALDRKLSVRQSAINEGLHAAGQVGKVGIARVTPVDTGRLRDSTDYRIVAPGHMVVGWISRAKQLRYKFIVAARTGVVTAWGNRNRFRLVRAFARAYIHATRRSNRR